MQANLHYKALPKWLKDAHYARLFGVLHSPHNRSVKQMNCCIECDTEAPLKQISKIEQGVNSFIFSRDTDKK